MEKYTLKMISIISDSDYVNICEENAIHVCLCLFMIDKKHGRLSAIRLIDQKKLWLFDMVVLMIYKKKKQFKRC